MITNQPNPTKLLNSSTITTTKSKVTCYKSVVSSTTSLPSIPTTNVIQGCYPPLTCPHLQMAPAQARLQEPHSREETLNGSNFNLLPLLRIPTTDHHHTPPLLKGTDPPDLGNRISYASDRASYLLDGPYVAASGSKTIYGRTQ
jgi:hypothetical protein